MKPYLFKLDETASKRLDRIAVYLAVKSGRPVNRTDALRHLIDSFILPDVAIDSQNTIGSQPLPEPAELAA